MKIPNYLTIGRIIIVPIFVFTYYLPGFYGDVIPFVLFVLAYVLMAWYDYIFDCQTLPLKKGSIGGITAIFKPKSHNKDKQEKHNETSKENKIKTELNTRKNDKHIQNLKTRRENLLNKYTNLKTEFNNL